MFQLVSRFLLYQKWKPCKTLLCEFETMTCKLVAAYSLIKTNIEVNLKLYIFRRIFTAAKCASKEVLGSNSLALLKETYVALVAIAVVSTDNPCN